MGITKVGKIIHGEVGLTKTEKVDRTKQSLRWFVQSQYTSDKNVCYIEQTIV